MCNLNFRGNTVYIQVICKSYKQRTKHSVPTVMQVCIGWKLNVASALKDRIPLFRPIYPLDHHKAFEHRRLSIKVFAICLSKPYSKIIFLCAHTRRMISRELWLQNMIGTRRLPDAHACIIPSTCSKGQAHWLQELGEENPEHSCLASFINPWRTCAGRVTPCGSRSVCLCVCASVC